MFDQSAHANERVGASVRSPGGLVVPAHAIGQWRLVARDPDGNVVHIDEWDNLVVDQGRNYLLDVGIRLQSAVAGWFVGLTGGTPSVVAGDTMASHGGWTEVQAYSQATRPAFSAGAASGGSVNNSGAVASFTINADSTTIGGAFLASVSTNGGTSGTLYAAGAFSGGNLVLNNGSTLEVTATFSV
jgi:hypothetical protein